MREILGIYLDKEELHYAGLARGFRGWAPKKPGTGFAPCGIIREPAPASLKDFLSRLSPRGSRRIYLTLPRPHFFARDVQLPPMPMEDALVSLQNSLSLYCHLPLDDIYHDIHLCRTGQGNINALIFYASRKEMDRYLSLFQDTGHQASLKGIFPLSFGVGAWLNMEGYALPMGVILSQDRSEEVAVYQRKGFLFSALTSGSEGEPSPDSLIAGVSAKFRGLEGRIFYLDGRGSPPLPPPPHNRLPRFPLVVENYGMAAAAPTISGQQEISIDGGPTRLKVFRAAKLVVPVVLALFLAVFYVTWQAGSRISGEEESLNALKTEVQQLEERLKPVVQNRGVLRKTKQFMDDMNSFMKTRPELYTDINDLANRVPQETWFSQLTFDRGTITLRGESKDALKVVEALRASNRFDQVKLRGSVSRTGAGDERFSLTIKLKEDETDK
jgi:Tfp pilus assembly protein PilN